jgi:probable selenium-dependent hydroxylase accessory protein YqeC
LAGPAPEALDALSRRLPDVTWLVEADGAKGRLLKAPAAYEPVIPAEADRVVVVAGLAAIGEPLDGDTVHRPEVAARLLGVPVGATVTPGLFARLVGHSSGGLNGIPGGADVVVLLAQWDNGPRDACVEAVAQRLVARRRVRRVVWADLEALDPVMGLWADG